LDPALNKISTNYYEAKVPVLGDTVKTPSSSLGIFTLKIVDVFDVFLM